MFYVLAESEDAGAGGGGLGLVARVVKDHPLDQLVKERLLMLRIHRARFEPCLESVFFCCYLGIEKDRGQLDAKV